VWQRIAIVAAGPIANFLLAIVLFWFLLLQGQRDLIPIIDRVEPGSIAAQAGLEAGQEIQSVDNIATPTWQALNRALLKRLGETGPIRFKATYPDSHFTYESEGRLVDWLKDANDPDPVAGLGITLYLPKMTPIVGEVGAGEVAESAGFQVGDKILSADGTAIDDWQLWIKYVQQRPNQPISVVIERDSRELGLTLVPESLEVSGKVI